MVSATSRFRTPRSNLSSVPVLVLLFVSCFYLLCHHEWRGRFGRGHDGQALGALLPVISLRSGSGLNFRAQQYQKGFFILEGGLVIGSDYQRIRLSRR